MWSQVKGAGKGIPGSKTVYAEAEGRENTEHLCL